jgi:two-component sensor histidine kinase
MQEGLSLADPARVMAGGEAGAEVAELRAQLAEKDEELRQSALLMREVNHRVANSLQLASSILRMQAHQEADPHTRDQLEKAGLRIGSIQHVHDRLYRSGDMRTIEFSQYLRDLCNDLADSVMQEEAGHRVKIESDCERIRVSTDIASKLGLVVNEFVTNAVKHGAGQDGDTKIRVVGQARENILVLQVEDNGVGLPKDFDITRIKGLGMRLVRFVAGSLGGEAGARNGQKGAIFFVTIPMPDRD